jgi:hypothetical protein
MGTETFHLFDDALLFPTKIDMNGGSKNPIMNIYAFQISSSKAGTNDIIYHTFYFQLFGLLIMIAQYLKPPTRYIKVNVRKRDAITYCTDCRLAY